MRETGIDKARIKTLSARLTAREFDWLRNTVSYALTTAYPVRQFAAGALARSYDCHVDKDRLKAVIGGLTDDELVWFCDNYKRPTQHARRLAARKSRRGER